VCMCVCVCVCDLLFQHVDFSLCLVVRRLSHPLQ
jgi:hypothetical protein